MLVRWDAFCEHNPCGSTCVFVALGSLDSPWPTWVFKWVADALQALDEFVRQVVVNRREQGRFSLLILDSSGVWAVSALINAKFPKAWAFLSQGRKLVVTPEAPREAIGDH